MNIITNRILRISENDDIILVGPNGSGKSRALRELCSIRVREGRQVIAISNTPYSRLPELSRYNYNHIGVNPGTTNEILKSLIVNSLDSESLSYSSMREILTYTGYEPIIYVNISIGRMKYMSERQMLTLLSETEESEIISGEVRFLFQNLLRIQGQHEVNLEDIFSFFRENETVALTIKHQKVINRVARNGGGKVSATFSLRKADGQVVPVHKASSGELTLITLAMFILTNSQNLDYVFIDEPENSLHPQWQSRFLNFMKGISRRENISYQLASHSPVLLTGALTSERNLRVVRCRQGHFDELRKFRGGSDDSVEELLWGAFDVITPASRFVAKRVSDLLWMLEENRISAENIVNEINGFIEETISNDQANFLHAAIDLVYEISKRQDRKDA